MKGVRLLGEAVCIQIWVDFLYRSKKEDLRSKPLKVSSPHQFPPFAYQTSLSSQLRQEELGLREGVAHMPHLMSTCLSLQRCSQTLGRAFLSLRKHNSPIPILQGLCCLQEGRTLSPSIAQVLISMGWTLLPSELYLNRRTSVQSSIIASLLRSTSPSLCLPS